MGQNYAILWDIAPFFEDALYIHCILTYLNTFVQENENFVQISEKFKCVMCIENYITDSFSYNMDIFKTVINI